MRALVLEPDRRISIREIEIQEQLGPKDVRIAICNVGICGSDIHYFQYGRIGPFVVREPLVLGHEGSGVVIQVGREVSHLKPGDRVCMEPGIPDPSSRPYKLGKYNLDSNIRFWATPPVHGILRPTVVHPADYTYKLPDTVSFAEGAMVEPLAVGLYAATKATIRPGDKAVVIGAGTIGILTALSALAGGCSEIILADLVQEKLDLAKTLGPIVPVNINTVNLSDVVRERTEGWGADIVFEASGNEDASSSVFNLLCPGGCVVFIGMPGNSIQYNVVAAQIVEARVEHVFRYAHMFPKALALLGSGRLQIRSLITDVFPFEKSVEAMEWAVHMPPTSIKAQIVFST
ncbi:MAG: NAD(P)-dependent alcohol dehydrogenase [Spirochaetales bacterium]